MFSFIDIKAKIHYTSFPAYSKSAASWRGQKSVVSVASSVVSQIPLQRLVANLLRTCCGLVGDILIQCMSR